MDTRKIVIILIVVALVAIGAGLFIYLRQPSVDQPEQPEQPASAPASGIPAEYQEIADQAVNLVASTLQVPVEEVTVLSVQAVTWSDTSLGCPEPGMMYAQVLTPGFLVTTEVQGKPQQVHMDAKGKGVVCPPERARPPAETE